MKACNLADYITSQNLTISHHSPSFENEPEDTLEEALQEPTQNFIDGMSENFEDNALDEEEPTIENSSEAGSGMSQLSMILGQNEDLI